MMRYENVLSMYKCVNKLQGKNKKNKEIADNWPLLHDQVSDVQQI